MTRATTLTDEEIIAVATQLARADQFRDPVEATAPAPTTLSDGYRVQAAGHGLHADDLIAWKAGCTNEAVQQMLEIDAPVLGRYRKDHVLSTPAALRFDAFATAPHLEVEVGLRLLRDIDEVPNDPLDLADAVEAFAAIEVVAGRLSAFPLVPVAQLVADNVASGRMIVGPTLDLTPDELRSLDAVPVALVAGGESGAVASGAEAMGHPLRVLAAVGAFAIDAHHPLRAGELVITGTCTGLVAAERGIDHVGRVGDAEVRVRFD
ncbi:2-keto-4-pentenoate hydratase [Ilumatobacter sp.]|uniref:2-keto-4-pentenoate hydratase n=1 Tax=Ilumatobacter sp. TaxID=1967498 RepID=UPI003C3C707A